MCRVDIVCVQVASYVVVKILCIVSAFYTSAFYQFVEFFTDFVHKRFNIKAVFAHFVNTFKTFVGFKRVLL